MHIIIYMCIGCTLYAYYMYMYHHDKFFMYMYMHVCREKWMKRVEGGTEMEEGEMEDDGG